MKRTLRELVASGRTIAALGATDALSAKLIAAHGFESVYLKHRQPFDQARGG